jgi:predicted small integral membrane protein
MGFLEKIGLKVTKGDKLFISGVLFMAVHLIWLAVGLDGVATMWPALIIAIIIGAIIMKWG